MFVTVSAREASAASRDGFADGQLSVKPDPRPHAAAQFSLCLTIAGRDPRCEVGVAQPDIHRPPLYGCYEIAPIDSRGSAPWTSMLYLAATSAIGA